MAQPLILYDIITIPNYKFTDDTAGTEPPTSWTWNSTSTYNSANVANIEYDVGSSRSVQSVLMGIDNVLGDDPHNITTDVSTGTYWQHPRVVTLAGLVRNNSGTDEAISQMAPGFILLEAGVPQTTVGGPGEVFESFDSLGTEVLGNGIWSGFNTTSVFAAGSDTIRIKLEDTMTAADGGWKFTYLFAGPTFDLTNLVTGFQMQQVDRTQLNIGFGSYEAVQLADPWAEITLSLARIIPGSATEAEFFAFMDAVRSLRPFAFWLDRGDFTNAGRHFETCFLRNVSGIQEGPGARGYKPILSFVAPLEYPYQYNATTGT